MTTIKFNGCKHLDFSDNYVAKKQLIALHQTKVFWMRENIDPELPTMVQFCKLRGRLNHPEACLSRGKAMCDDYYEDELVVEINEEDL